MGVYIDGLSFDITDEPSVIENHNNQHEKIDQYYERMGFRGKILRLFQPEKFGEPISTEQGPTSISGPSEPYIPQEYVYIQMRLDIENPTDTFLQELEEYRLSGIKIRKATLNDVSSVVKLYNRSFMRGSDPWSPATEEQFLEILAHENTVILIASLQGEDVGFIITDLEGDHNQIGVICGLGTDPRWQRRGYGRYLGIAAFDYFRKLNVQELRCEVYEKNVPSHRLINGLHFKEYGRNTYCF